MPRTPEFDRRAVVDQAMQVFWQRGYGQTTVTDLVAATGLQPGSLYAAFGSKKGVFLEVLECYSRGFLERVRAMADESRPALEGIREMLAAIIEDTVSGRNLQGCLAVNSLLELAAHDPDVADRIDQHNTKVRRAIAVVIERAQVDGEVHGEQSADALAAFLLNNLWGMRVMCRSRPDRASLEAVVDGILRAMVARR